MLQVLPFRRAVLCTAASLCVIALSGCGGGGSSGGGGGGGAANRAPQITSASTASVTENATSALTLAASDADGDAVSFAVTGGADAGAFTVSGTSLAFRNAADFERPADSNRDNIYNLTVEARDGRGGVASVDLVVTVTNSKEGIAVTRVASGFTSPAGLGALLVIGAPAGKIAVAQTSGEIFEVDGTTGARTLLADVFAGRPRGRVLAITYYSRPSNFYGGLHAVVQEADGRVFVQRYTRTALDESEVLPSGSAQVSAAIFSGPVRGLPGGDLFMTVSDEGGSFAQNSASRLGKLIFLQEKDPFAGAAATRAGYNVQVVGTGIRRSGGAGAINGEILLSDQGASIEHELNFFLPDARPLDFGWPGREGTQGIGANPPAAVVGPKIAYGFGTGPDQGTGVIFGGLYRGPIADLDNRFVFGDRSGAFWSVRFSDLTNNVLLGPPQMDRRRADFVPNVGAIEAPVAFTTDDQGRMFILDSDGELFRIDAA
jgi:hypothetical protein